MASPSGKSMAEDAPPGGRPCQVRRLGIIGGGQLGRMMIMAATTLGISTAVLDASTECPCAAYTTNLVQGSLYDHEALERLMRQVTHVTAEIEHFDAMATEDLATALGVCARPCLENVCTIQDKYRQKQFL